MALVITEGLSHLKWTFLERPWLLSSFVLFDEASHGPWGSARLLARFGARWKYAIPSLGSLVTILLLPIDPFVQQLLQFHDCPQDVTSEGMLASIPRAQIIVKPSSDDYLTISPAFRSAALQGLFATSLPQVQPVCKTGNCAFSEEFHTVGFCGSCIDMSDTIVRRAVNGSADATGAEALTYVLDTYSGTYQNVSIGVFYDEQTHEINSTLLAMTVDIEWPWHLGREGSDPVNISLIRTQYVTDSGSDSLDDSFGSLASWYSSAFTCSIRPCLRGCQAKVTDARLVEKSSPVSERTMGRSDLDWVMADLDCLNRIGTEQQRRTLQRLGYDLGSSSRWLSYNVSLLMEARGEWQSSYGSWVPFTIYAADIPPEAMDLYTTFQDQDSSGAEIYLAVPTDEALQSVPIQCIYQLDYSYIDTLNMLWAELFNGTLEGDSHGRAGPTALESIYTAGSGNGTDRDIQSVFESIAESLTTYVRSHELDDYGAPALGTIQQNVTCVRVRWPWIGYLAVLTFLFFTFCAAIIRTGIMARNSYRKLSSSREPTPPHDFKSSVLPVLFHGLDSDSIDALCNRILSSSTKDLDQIVKEMKVKLANTKDGLKIVLQTKESQTSYTRTASPSDASSDTRDRNETSTIEEPAVSPSSITALPPMPADADRNNSSQRSFQWLP